MKVDKYASFDKSLVNALSDINVDLSEGILDSFIDSNILDAIPIVKTIKAGVLFGNTLKYIFFQKKILRFLYEIQNVTEDDRLKFIQELENSGCKKKVYDNTLLVIDRLDDELKSSIVGKLFSSLIEKKINREEYFRLVNIVEKVYIDDLEVLKFKSEKYRLVEKPIEIIKELEKDSFKETMANVGVYRRHFENKDSYQKRKKETIILIDYRLSVIGELLVNNGF